MLVSNYGRLYITEYYRQARVVYIIMSMIGCALGGIVRYLGMAFVTRLAGERFPWGTLVVNSIGSFILGALLGSGMASGGIVTFLLLGFCGGLTTFSTFSLQVLSLISEKAWYTALSSMLVSVVLCVLCVLCGYVIGSYN